MKVANGYINRKQLRLFSPVYFVVVVKKIECKPFVMPSCHCEFRLYFIINVFKVNIIIGKTKNDENYTTFKKLR